MGSWSADEGRRLTVTSRATDADVPANALTFSATGLPTGAIFDPATRTFSWTPSEAQGPGTFPGVIFTVNDGQGGTASETIQITVTEVNQAPVVNDQPFSVAENSANGTVVGTIVATDADIPVNTQTFAVTAGTGQAEFAADATTGQITVTNSSLPNIETTPSFTLNVTVTDNATPALSDTAVITINLTNVNEAPVLTA